MTRTRLCRQACVLSVVATGVLLAVAPRDTRGAGSPPCTTVQSGDDLQAAVDRAAARGKAATLCLAAAEFRLQRFLSIVAGDLTMRGEGSATVLRVDDGVHAPVVVIGDYRHRVPAHPVANVVLERVRIVGGGPDGGEHLAARPYLTNSAVVVRRGRRIAVRDLEVSACRSACILTEHDTRDVAIERNTITGSTWDGISLNRTTRAHVADNTIERNTAAGITAEHLEDSVLERNLIRGNRSHGIYLSDSLRNRFVANRFLENTNAGVFLTCAVRDRDPGPVLCWPDSMSQANAFERNAFLGNRRGYIVAADAAANCTSRSVVPNVSRADRFDESPSIEQPERFGACLVKSDDAAVPCGER